jgi:hypothetical protein
MRCQPRAPTRARWQRATRLHDLERHADVAAVLTRAGATD